MFKKKRRGVVYFTYNGKTTTIPVIVEELESAGDKTHIKVESIDNSSLQSYQQDEFKKSIPEWITTANITWIGEDTPPKGDRPTDLIDAVAYDLALMKCNGKNPELIEVMEKLVLSEEDRATWDMDTMARSIRDLLS